jgi:hypothetical protein
MTAKPHDAKQMTAQPNDPDDKCQVIDAKSRNEGGGLMLWIMVSPGRGFRDITPKRKTMNIEKRGEFHGKDHPGNQ